MPRLLSGSRSVAAGVASLTVGTALLLAACSSDTPATPDDPVLQRGAEVYSTRCQGCHGPSGGGGAGPKLAGRMEEAYPELEDQMAVIREGRGSMPAFGSALSEEDIEAVARYEREVL